jgi:hypothetical protein
VQAAADGIRLEAQADQVGGAKVVEGLLSR